MDDFTQGLLAEIEHLHSANEAYLKQYSGRNLLVSRGLFWGFIALGVCGGTAGMISGFRIAGRTVNQVEQSEREAARAEQLATVGQLAAGLAHELRNPLMTMEVLIQAATEHGDAGRLAGRDLIVLEDEIQRLKALVSSFLDFARPPTPSSIQFDFSEVAQRTVDFVSSRGQRQGVSLEALLPNKPIKINADPVQIRQVVLNLLLNAIDSQPDGGQVTLRCRTVRVLGAGSELTETTALNHLEFSVSDHGPGIDADQEEHIFEPFVSSKETGMGLGLAVCRRIVEAHGGHISVDNGVNHGACFTVTLPLGKVDAD